VADDEFEYERDEETGENFIHLTQEFTNNLIYGDRVFIQGNDVQRGDRIRPVPANAEGSVYAEGWTSEERFLTVVDVQHLPKELYPLEIWFEGVADPGPFHPSEFIEIDTKEGT
jgi:hypothetical protein